MKSIVTVGRRALMAVLCFAGACLADGEAERAQHRLDPGAARANVDKATQLIFDGTNEFRAENKLPALKRDETLDATAMAFAKFMAETHKYGHEADGRKPADRAEAKGYAYCVILENIALQFRSDGFETMALGRSFVEAWKNSPGHRKNMLDPNAVEAGMATAVSSNGVYYSVQLFGRPKSMVFDVRLENRSRTAVRYTLGDTEYDLGPRVIRTHSVCLTPTMKFALPAGSTPPDERLLNPVRATTFVITDNGGAVKINGVEKK
ncbi:MAG TPA: CAP domain-containing protein [Tepidisphaeraceae bacterium]|jgi:uncharacterized protein YkwD